MRVIEWPRFLAGEFPGEQKTAMTIGVFDGVHRGHQALIGAIVRRSPCVPTVVTFRRNPRELLGGRPWEGDILSLRRRLALLEGLGAASVILIDFSVNFSRLGGKEFVDLLKSRGNLGYLALGSNFRCGFRLDTGAASIKGMNEGEGIPTDVLEPVLDGGKPVSSSRIREAIRRGRLSRAAALLGRKAELDFSDMAAESRQGGTFFSFPDLPRVMPPPGPYRALLRGSAGGPGIETEIHITEGGVLVPPPFSAAGAELISGASGPPG
jgi:riboflavin kinase/FMN adenylyltransferase